MEKVDIVLVIPIGLEAELYYAKEIIKDLECYYKKSFHIIFVDDTEDFRLKNFYGKKYTTIWSGCQGIRININKKLLEKEKTIFFTVTAGLIYAYRNFNFDFLQFMETDCAVINPGLDEWLYEMQKEYGFDLLGPLDDEAKTYEPVINIKNYCKIIPCFYEHDNILYLLNNDATYKYPVMFFAIHFYSYNMIKKLVELDEKYAFLRSKKLLYSCNTVSTEPHFTTIVRLLGGKIVFYGGMDQQGPTGSAKPPLLSFHPWYKKHTLYDTLIKFKIVHSLKSFSNCSLEETRRRLSLIRDERYNTSRPTGDKTIEKIMEEDEKNKFLNGNTTNNITLFAVYNKEQEKLKDIFIRTIKDDWEINMVKLEIPTGDFRSLNHNEIMKKKLEMAVKEIRNNANKILIVSDIDIQFFAKCTSLILEKIRGKDILFQSARVHPNEWKLGEEVNTGFMVMKCNERTLELFRQVISSDWNKYNNSCQFTMNELLRTRVVEGLEYGVLPEQFWLPKWYKIDPPRDIVMHHAIQTGEKGCNDKNLRIDLKIAQMEKIKKYVVINTNYKQWSFARVLKKILLCLEERRLPDFVSNYLANTKNKIKISVYILKLQSRHFSCSINKGQQLITGQKFLYVSAVGRHGKNLLATVIQRFGYKDFDYLIFVYDSTDFPEEIFKGCHFIHEVGLKWQFARKYLTEEYCKKYSHFFIWDDDIDISNFSYKHFIEIMQRNNIELAQPALSCDSYFSHKITLQDKTSKIGRYVDFVEVMIPVFRNDAWVKFRKMLDENTQSGWGYDFIANDFCNFKSMGIVDCETVTHTRPIRSNNTDAPRQMEALFKSFKGYKLSMMVNYGWLR